MNFLHVGICVKNLEESVKFYKEVMKMEEEFRAYHSGDKISQVVGVENAELNVCVLKKGDMRIELIEYGNKIGNSKVYKPQNELGIIHIAFGVDDIDKEYDRIKSYGFEFNAPPMVTRVNGPKITYFKGLDNVVIEIYQKVN